MPRPLSETTFKITFHVAGSGFIRLFAAWLKRNFHGEIVEFESWPTSRDLRDIGLDRQIITCLVNAKIANRHRLAALTEPEVLALEGIDWLEYRTCVRALHTAGLGLKGAPPYEDSVESFAGFAGGHYVRLRKAGFRLASDFTTLDYFDVVERVSYEAPSSLRIELQARGLSLARPHSSRVLADLVTFGAGHQRSLTPVGLRPDTPLAKLTRGMLTRIVEAKPKLKYLIEEILRLCDRSGIELPDQ